METIGLLRLELFVNSKYNLFLIVFFYFITGMFGIPSCTQIWSLKHWYVKPFNRKYLDNQDCGNYI